MKKNHKMNQKLLSCHYDLLYLWLHFSAPFTEKYLNCNFCPSFFPVIVLLTLIWLLSYHKMETALARSLSIDTFCQFIYQFSQQLLTLCSLLVFLLPLPALLNLFCWLFLLNLVTKRWNVLGVLPWMLVL